MREILFRGKRTDNGEWVEGCYSKGFRDPNTAQLEDLIYMFSGKPGEWEFDYAVVIPETVGQYTGLTDENGKRIFEGDVVAYARDEEVGQIAYHENEAMFVVEFDTWLTDFDHMYGKDLEVIGNIHDNPELMKDGAEK